MAEKHLLITHGANLWRVGEYLWEVSVHVCPVLIGVQYLVLASEEDGSLSKVWSTMALLM